MQISPHTALLEQQRCLLLAVVGRCNADELHRFRIRVDRFAEASTPDTPMARRERLRYGLATMEDMLAAIERHFEPLHSSQSG